MPSADDQAEQGCNDVQAIYSQWLREPAGADFETLCAAHRHLETELRKLHSLVQLAQSAATSGSFHQTLREQFGDDAEVTVKLGEGASTVLPPSGTRACEPSKAGAPNTRYSLEGEVARGGM